MPGKHIQQLQSTKSPRRGLLQCNPCNLANDIKILCLFDLKFIEPAIELKINYCFEQFGKLNDFKCISATPFSNAITPKSGMLVCYILQIKVLICIKTIELAQSRLQKAHN